MEHQDRIDAIAAELVRLVGYGAQSSSWISAEKTIELMREGSKQDIPASRFSEIINTAISQLEAPLMFDDAAIPLDNAQRAYRRLLKLGSFAHDRASQSVRREAAMNEIGARMSVSTWRHASARNGVSPEQRFMRPLAKQLIMHLASPKRERYRIESVESTYYYGPTGDTLERISTLAKIEVLVDDLELMRPTHEIPTEPRRGVIEFESGIGCTLVGIEEPDDNSSLAIFDLRLDPKPFRGQVIGYGYSVRIASMRPLRQSYDARQIQSQVDWWSFTLAFPTDHAPAFVWHFESAGEPLIPRTPDLTRLVSPHNGVFRHTFMRPELRCFIGLAWRH